MTLAFPFAVLDFEASSLSDERSYPIEVGVAVATGPGKPIALWSSLIRPAAEWVASGQWSARSEAIHGISLRELAGGASPDDVAQTLNAIAAAVRSWLCDGGEYDAHWLRRLFGAARMEPTFGLRDLSELFVSDAELTRGLADALARSQAPHRAGADAVRLCAAILAAHDDDGGEVPARVIETAEELEALVNG